MAFNDRLRDTRTPKQMGSAAATGFYFARDPNTNTLKISFAFQVCPSDSNTKII